MCGYYLGSFSVYGLKVTFGFGLGVEECLVFSVGEVGLGFGMLDWVGRLGLGCFGL